MRQVSFVTACVLTTALVLIADQPSINGKPDFSGKWRAESSAASSMPTWTIEQSDDNKIHIRELKTSDEAVSEVQCGTKAVECPGKIDGKNAKVVFYYNGPKLVQITRQGKDVIKTRYTLSDDGQKITMELIPYVPAGDPETVVLVRSDSQEQNTTAKAQ